MATEFIGIELQLIGGDAVLNSLREIDRIGNSLGGKKKIDMGLKQLQRDLVVAEGKLREFKRLQEEAGGEGKSAFADMGVKETTQEIREMNAAIKTVRASARTLGDTFKQTFDKTSSAIAHAGSAMQSLGNSLTRIGSIFRPITTGLLMGAGYKALNTFTEGLSRGFTRYDTMKKYPKIMAAFGYSAQEAQESINALDLSVRGLPTGLDEMVDLAQRFTATTGDIQKGTKLAIATNNAFLASMSTDTQKYQGMMQLQDVLGGKDMNSREWNSLVSSMTPAITKMGEYLKKTGEWNGSIGEFIQHVRDGKMANEDFVDTLIKIGNKGGVLESMAQESKNTWSAFFANVGNAAARMTEGVIKSFDEISRQAFGKDMNMLFIDTIIPAIDKMAASAQKWIKAHPEQITDFFNTLKSIDWGGLLKGIAKGFGDIVGYMQKLSRISKSMNLEKWGRGLAQAGFWGRVLTIGGGLLKGTRHIWASLAVAARLIGRIAKIGGGGIFGSLGKLFGSKKAIESAGEAAKSVPTVSQTFKSAFSSLEGLIKAAGAVAIVSGTGAIAFKSVKSMVKDIKDITNLFREMSGWDVATGVGVSATIYGLTKAFEAMGEALEKGGALHVAIASLATLMVGGTFAGLMAEIKFGLKQLKGATVLLKEIGNELSTFESPDIDVSAITKTISDIDQVYAALSGQGQQTTGSRVGRFFGFMKNPLGSALGGLGKGAADAMQAGAIASKLNSILAAIKSLKNVANQVNSLGSIKIEVASVENIHNMTEAIKGIIKHLQEAIPTGRLAVGNLVKNATGIANALYQMRRMAYSINRLAGTTINTSGFSTFSGQLKTVISELTTVFGDTESQMLVTQINKFVTALKNAFDQFKQFNKTIVIKTKVKLDGGFRSSVNAAVRQIRRAGSDIQAAVNSIPSELTKSVTVRVVVNTIVSGMSAVRNIAQDVLNNTQATGGTIYRAGGGGIPNFKRRGTDTVPAMLTPGEYVHNKKAVNLFGIDFMRKVNNLDMRGAMNELMTRAGGMVNGNHGTTINNYYNNNQRVTQNINTNSPDFAFRSASRFVGAF